MGVVDLAVGPDGRPVAIKRLSLHGSVHDMNHARQRIRREADALLQLEHPNIVRLLEVIDDGDDIVLVMPYFGGGTLADQVHAHGPLSPQQVRTLGPPLLGALATAHRQGIVHRDIKPANVFFDLDGRPYLGDFGVASLRDATSGLTLHGALVGTPEFMAPEQARGELITPASDVFSLGATLVYAASGQAPYGRGEPRVLVHLAAKGRVLPISSEIPADIRRVLAPMIDKSQRRRPTATHAAAAMIGQGAAGTQVEVLPAAKKLRRTRRPTTLPVLAALVVVMAVVFAAVAWNNQRHVAEAAVPTTIGAPLATNSTAPPCVDKLYQRCGQPEVAPFTDGLSCTEFHADYDNDRQNGCEAAPDSLEGKSLVRTLSANLVPADDIDRYPFHIADNLDIFNCDGAFVVSLTAPKATTMRFDLFQGTRKIGSATSENGQLAKLTVREQSCLSDESVDLVVQVSSVGAARSAANYRLDLSGSF